MAFDFIDRLRIFTGNNDFDSVTTYFTNGHFFRATAIDSLANGTHHSIHDLIVDFLAFRLHLKHHVGSTGEIDPETETLIKRLTLH